MSESKGFFTQLAEYVDGLDPIRMMRMPHSKDGKFVYFSFHPDVQAHPENYDWLTIQEAEARRPENK